MAPAAVATELRQDRHDVRPKANVGREQFELRTHKRLLDITDSRPQTMDALTKLDLPAGVDVEIKVE